MDVVSHFIGSGFGGKLFPWPHSALAAAASRKLNRPVKFTLGRKMMFANSGHRPRTEQRIRLGATPEGKLRFAAAGLSQPHELCAMISVRTAARRRRFCTARRTCKVTSALVRRNVGTPTPMRGPGAVPGLFALESAMDELAIKLKMDPVELRIWLDTLVDEEQGKPFSSRHLKECLQVGAEKFGWSKRTPERWAPCEGGRDSRLGRGVLRAGVRAGASYASFLSLQRTGAYV